MCDVPKRSWVSALAPKRVLLAVLGLGVAVAGALLGGIEGIGLVAVAIALLVGAVVLPSVREVEFGFPVGVRVRTAARSREEELREIFAAQRADFELCAHLLCEDSAAATELLEAAWADTTRNWRGPTGPELRVYVLCVLVELVRAYGRWVEESPAQEPARARLRSLSFAERVAVVLHDFARLPTSQIALVTGESAQDVQVHLRNGQAVLDGTRSAGGVTS